MLPSTTVLQAIEMRKEGNSYPVIAKTLGISVDWCKRKLKNVPVTDHLAQYNQGKV